MKKLTETPGVPPTLEVWEPPLPTLGLSPELLHGDNISERKRICSNRKESFSRGPAARPARGPDKAFGRHVLLKNLQSIRTAVGRGHCLLSCHNGCRRLGRAKRGSPFLRV